MNIIYFVPNITIAGGIFRIVSDKMNYLAENMEGRLFLAYYGNGQEKPIYPLHPNIQLLPIDIEWKVGFGKKINRVWKNISIIRHILKKYKIDIAVNANAPLLIWILPFICRRIKKIHEFHFSYKGQQILDEEIFKSRGKKFLVQYLRKCCLTKFDKVIALTESDKKMWNLPNIFVIPNFSNIQLHERNGRKSKVAISAGRLESVKGYNRLIAAWVIVAQKCPDWQLEIWGEGSLRESLQRQIDALHLSSVVHLKGVSPSIGEVVAQKCPDWQLEIWGEGSLRESLQRQIDALHLSSVVHLKGVSPSIGEVYSHSSFFVMSSLYEGFPLVLVEAMNCGLPCVSFDITGANSIIDNGKNGFLVPDNDVNALAEACIKLIENKVLLEDMGKQAYMSGKCFSKPKVMQKWLDLFRELMRE